MATDNPELQSVAQAIANAIPSATERGVNLGAADVAKAQPKIQALIAAGVEPELASLVALGEVNLTTSQGGPGGLSDIEARGLRDQIQVIRQARFSLQESIPLINFDSVGIMGKLNESFGGITSQLPGIKQIQNAIGVFDEKTVSEAIQARNAFRQTIEFLKPFATRKGARLSNEDRTFITKLSGFLDTAQDEETVRGTAQRMLGIMTKLETAAAQDLNRGAIELAPASGGSTEFSEEDIKFTMEKHGLSREEVLRRLSAQ
jgi:NACalpha-BTF3-like transcription factor